MTNSMFNWTRWISQPFWVLAMVQIVVVTVFILLGNETILGGVRQEIVDIKQQIDEQSQALHNIQQQLAMMPLLADMQAQLATETTDQPPFHTDMLAQLVAHPLSHAGAVLLSLQPEQQKSQTTSMGDAWILTFRADYLGLLTVIRQFTALPYVLRIERLAVRSTETPLRAVADHTLHVEMVVMRPIGQWSQRIE
ncbi:hypothetical protein [Pectobacterium sp. B1J-3]|uniref:hypothetical protein n=1 Tax=Pectobacterium sp. B1J-3 TaxID=3385371 RepID=UPI003906C0BA